MKLTTEDIKNKILVGTYDDRRRAWHSAAGNGYFNVSNPIWEWVEEKLTTEEVNNKL